jgi:hypothetical protein
LYYFRARAEKGECFMETFSVPLIFFSFLALCVIAGAWKRKKIETIRHETARLLIEKNPAIDSDMLAQLFNPPPPKLGRGTAYRMMSVIGCIVIATGLGLWAMCLWFIFAGGHHNAMDLGGPATLVAIIGAGTLFAARFMPRPPVKDAETGGHSASPINGSEP